MKKGKTRDEEFLKQVRGLRCMACGAPAPSEAHHVLSKGAGGGDDFWNVIPLCSDHHTFGSDSWHRMGAQSFLAKNPHIYQYLVSLGWQTIGGKLKRPHGD